MAAAARVGSAQTQAPKKARMAEKEGSNETKQSQGQITRKS
jgi:hypothetical protein